MPASRTTVFRQKDARFGATGATRPKRSMRFRKALERLKLGA